MARAVQHSSKTNNYGTPQHVLEAERTLMGTIDLDPCSSQAFNSAVRARQIFDRGGLEFDWTGHANVHVNPPGGRVESDLFPPPTKDHSQPALWWAVTWGYWYHRAIEQACFVIFNAEVLRHSIHYQQFGVAHPLEFPCCIFADRLDFTDESLTPQTAPGHWNALVWLPPDRESVPRFEHIFRPLGHVFDPAKPFAQRS